MSLCFVFSGTSEGREVCEALAEGGVQCITFVATEYGNAVMKQHENIDVRVGRLDMEDIAKLIGEENPDYVIDATHPHAEIITENIKVACAKAKADEKYIRVQRDLNSDTDEYSETVIIVNSIQAAIDALASFPSGNIMLTTGVKELHFFEMFGSRLIARILPGRESIDEAYRCGLSTKQIIAMEGPFSEEMNAALIKQYGASVLVTKNSGKRGGYIEKIKACKACGIKAIVIDNVACSDLGSACTESDTVRVLSPEGTADYIFNNIALDKEVYLVGTGVCKEQYLTIKAKDVIEHSDLIIGAKRMVEFGHTINEYAEVVCEYYPDAVAEIIKNTDKKKIAVLFSGDTGLCSGANGVRKVLEEITDIKIMTIPGMSSVSYFASKIGIQYSDYPFVNLHGKESNCESVIRSSGGFIAICSGVSDVRNVAKLLLKYPELNMTVGYNLGLETETIYKVNNCDEVSDCKEGLYIIFVS